MDNLLSKWYRSAAFLTIYKCTRPVTSTLKVLFLVSQVWVCTWVLLPSKPEENVGIPRR